MKIQNYIEKVAMPEGVTCKSQGEIISIKGPLGEVTKEFKMPALKFSIENNSVVISCDKFGAYEKEKFFTVLAHLKNMINGTQNGYVYMLKVSLID